MTLPEQRPVAVCKWFRLAYDDERGPYIETCVKGIPLLRFVLLNKGTAFTMEERRDLDIDGLLPTRVSTMQEQIARAYRQYELQTTPLARYQYLRGLQERQEVLFHALVEQHIEEMMPIVYTPTVGDAVEQFSALFQSPRGLTVNDDNLDRIEHILDNYPLYDIRVMVVTDSSAILGIGDQGLGGLGISIGKLTLYALGGVSPLYTMPVCLDVGTDHASHKLDPLYLGSMDPRKRGEDHAAFIHSFVKAIHERWPEAIIQWEDLAKESAFTVLERYRDVVPCLNDDIQGTGAVTLAGVLSACRKKGETLTAQRFLVHGAGAGGIGVATALRDALVRDGLSAEEAHERIYVLDSRGLLLTDRELPRYKQPFARDPGDVADWTFEGQAPGLVETARQAGITVLLGLSGQPGVFTEEVVRAIASHTDRPVVFPLSNPTKLAEAMPADILDWTRGHAIVATGSPFDDVVHDGVTHRIGQGNNAYVFPGLGLGAMLARVRSITDTMVGAAARAVAHWTETRHPHLLYPPLRELPEVSRAVAQAVIEQAVEDGVAREEVPSDPHELAEWIDVRCWRPEHLPIVYKDRPAWGPKETP